MTDRQSKQERAKGLLFSETMPDSEDYSPERRRDWYAQPAIGADIKTYMTSSSHPEPPGDVGGDKRDYRVD